MLLRDAQLRDLDARTLGTERTRVAAFAAPLPLVVAEHDAVRRGEALAAVRSECPLEQEKQMPDRLRIARGGGGVLRGGR